MAQGQQSWPAVRTIRASRSGRRVAQAHSSGIPALRRPSYDRSLMSRKRGLPPRDIWDDLPRRDRLERRGGGRREVALQRLARFRILIGQGERRRQDHMCKLVFRIDCERPARQFNRLIITLQPEIGPRLAVIPIVERRIVWARQYRLVQISPLGCTEPSRT